ncbi:TonB-dependent receptor [Paracoccus sp. NSM]|uniref:TonB-dependent receptor n=1 Tax=Paracoccus sp. NSM TaxID=3457784 RepID=UPI004036DE49
MRPFGKAARLVATTAMTALIAGWPGSEALAQGGDVMVLDEIILRGERLAKTPLETESSVHVLDEAAIERANATTVYEAVQSAPNVLPAPADRLPPIRGVDSDGPFGLRGNDLYGTAPRASLIVDGVPRISSYVNNGFQSLFDVEQVEVLRGPQTTLRGTNSIAGAFVVRTKDPVFLDEGQVTLGAQYDGVAGTNWRGGLMVNRVLAPDELAARLVLEAEDGAIPVDFADDPTGILSAYDRVSGRTKLLWQPAQMPGLTAILSAEYQEGRDTGFDSFISGTGLTGRPPSDRIAVGTQRLLDTKAWGLSLDVSQEGNSGTLRSLTSIQREDFAMSPESTENFVSFDDFGTRNLLQELTWEFGANGPLTGVAGLSHHQQRKSVDFGLFVDLDTRQTRRSTAAFMDLSYALSDRVELLGGARLHHESNAFTTSNNSFGNVSAVDFDETETVFLPKLGIGYAVAEDQRVFATIRRGYNGGGAGVNFFTGVPFVFDPEYVTTVEAGYRGELRDGSVALATTLFHNRYDGYHAYVSAPGNPLDYSIANLDGTSWGGEFEVAAYMTDDLRLRGGLGLLRTRVDAPGQAIDGNRFGNDPRTTLTIGADWSPRPGLTLDANAVRVSGYFPNFSQTEGQESGDYWNLDLGVSYARDNLSMRAYVANALDELQYVARDSRDGAGSVLEPRRIGATLTYAF